MTLSRQLLFGKLDLTLFKSIESATTFCKLRGNPYVEIAHWLCHIVKAKDSDLRRIVKHFQIDADCLEIGLEKALSHLPTDASSIIDFSHHIELVIERAWIHASLEFEERKIRSSHLLVALLSTPELRRVLTGIFIGFKNIPIQELIDMLPVITQGSIEEGETSFDGGGFPCALPGEVNNAMVQRIPTQNSLALYCTDLTQQAREGKIDPVIGREHEIRTIIDILLRRRQNNPLLTGDAGVGKTAVVEGFALAISRGEVPPSLADTRLLSLDVAALLAGASMKGEFELRLKGVLEEVIVATSPVILFIDEIHTLVGAGGTAGTGDAANLLKPSLARGILRTIGATTWSEYKRHIEKDPALARRFQVVQIPEPAIASAITMLRGLVSTLEKHHGVWILDEAILAAVNLSHRYIPASQLPDKAIRLLDTACARVAITFHAPPAALQMLRFQLLAAEIEAGMLKKEQSLGRPNQEKIAKLHIKIVKLQQDAKTQEFRWEAEKALTERLLLIRQKLAGSTLTQEVKSNPDIVESLPKASIGSIKEKISVSTLAGVQELSEARWPIHGFDAAVKTDEPSDQPEEADLQEALRKLEAELRELQQDTPMVHSEVNASVIASIVADWTGIPVGRMLQDKIDAVLKLPDQLAQRVIGQSAALALISERLQTASAGMSDPGKPIGVFLLVGPSGVGKTETAFAISEMLYGGEQNLITINMSEYQEAHTVSSLKGAPPGYVGYGDGGVLTEAVRRRPYSVVLLDEIEKAHPDVHEVFYQVFDKGWMEDGEGRVIDFRNTVLLLTSNVGGELLSNVCENLDQLPEVQDLLDALQPELLSIFPSAFIGRVCIVPYLPLMDDSIAHIVSLQLDRVCARMKRTHQITLEYSSQVVSYIVAHCPTEETGARTLISFIEQKILPGISRYWLDMQGKGLPIKRLRIDMESGKIVYHPE
ncbi:type VI secretion system ATPase TssH [Glaciimonas sp. CA11.2]|uniref:type VI secretion system ATPase TssH n=2 Tax=Glaciimonas sp. CA11.2 TaxID=3048601 RepID=UPI002AB50219|nr:type VI secretion system ATPase TssH [Glaciimonas sp. CA11.2]MDY7544839.1 type VI secretion system ATPase TssH [Glaciimonas sp. CA11.2]